MQDNQCFIPLVNLDEDNINEFAAHINELAAVDLVDLIEANPPKQRLLIFNVLNDEKAVAVFENLSVRVQQELLNELPTEKVASILNALSPDDRTALLSELPDDTMHLLIKHLSPEERALTTRLLGYPEDSVGRLMTPDYIAVKMDWTVQQVLDYIRTKGRDSETISVIYAIDDQGKLVDDFRIREFLFASLDAHVRDLADGKVIALKVNDDEEKAINIFRKYERVALPVVDTKGIMLGIVTVDDIMHVAMKEDTEDFQKIGGVAALNEPYMRIPFLDLMQKRAGWLVLLFIGEMFTASAMSYYEDAIAKAVVLALFLPLIISSGGNAGSQASTLIIRALALGEVTLKDWGRIMRRELMSGVFLGLVLGTIGFFRITIWTFFSTLYGEHWLMIAVTIFFALIGVVLWGSLMGALLPLLLKRLGFDPASSSAPCVATLVDVTGIIIYFTIAMFILQGTLL